MRRSSSSTRSTTGSSPATTTRSCSGCSCSSPSGCWRSAPAGSVIIYAIRNRSQSDARIRDALFAHALRLDAAYHDRVGPGELLSRASSDSQHVARMMDAIGHTIGYVLTVVAVAVVMLVARSGARAGRAHPLPVVSVAAWRYSRRYDAGTQRLQERLGRSVDPGRGDRQRHPRRQGPRRGRRALERSSATAATRSLRASARARAARRGLQPPSLEMLPLIGIAGRALARRPERDRRRPHARLVRRLQRATW